MPVLIPYKQDSIRVVEHSEFVFDMVLTVNSNYVFPAMYEMNVYMLFVGFISDTAYSLNQPNVEHTVS
jgi:hypothetical protein